MLKKWIAASLAMSLTISLLTGCGDNKEKKENNSDDTTKVVQVTKVDGNTITANEGELRSSQQEMPHGGGTPPSGAPNDDKQKDGGAPPESKPGDNQQENETPPGGKPDGNQQDVGTPPEGTSSEKLEDKQAESGTAAGNAADNNQSKDGTVSSGETDNDNTPPEQPDGGAAGKKNGNPPGKSGGSSFTANGESITFIITDYTRITQEFQQGSEDASVEDIVENSVLEITLNSQNQAKNVVIKNLQLRKGFGGSDQVTNGSAANTLSEAKSVDGESYSSQGDDENALRVDGADVSLKNITVQKTGGNSSNTENGDFYGQNAGLLVLNGSNATIEGGTFQTSALNGNAVFCYGEGTTVNISDAKIRTTKDNSGGIQTTGGGTTNAANLDVQTEGNSAAAIEVTGAAEQFR